MLCIIHKQVAAAANKLFHTLEQKLEKWSHQQLLWNQLHDELLRPLVCVSVQRHKGSSELCAQNNPLLQINSIVFDWLLTDFPPG